MEDEETLKKRADLVQKWSALGFLDGLDYPIKKENIAQLYESEASHLLNESHNDVPFSGVIFPTIRRLFSGINKLYMTPLPNSWSPMPGYVDAHMITDSEDSLTQYKIILIEKYQNG